jgi:tRNA(fMet)-specific endonuclease VapC
VARLILDTGALIALERGNPPDDPLLDDDDVAIAAVTASELLVGVELASPARQEDRRDFVEGLLERVQILAFDLAVARHHAQLLAYVRRQGRPRGAHDLQIAATAQASARTVITTDQTAFLDLPTVSVRIYGRD